MAKSPSNPRLKALEKALGIACYEADLATVRKILGEAPDLARTAQPILNACFAGSPDIVQVLLAHGADPNVLGKTGHRYRPLHRTCEFKKTRPKHTGHAQIVSILLAAGADPLSRGLWFGFTALAVAACGAGGVAAGGPATSATKSAGGRVLVDLLLPACQPLDIFSAAVLGDLKTVTQLLKKSPRLATQTDTNGATALLYAAASRLWQMSPSDQLNFLAITDLLLSAGANPNAAITVAGKDYPVVWFAASHPAVLKRLLSQGADPARALSYALWERDYPTAKLLITAGADITRPPLANEVPAFAHWGHFHQSRWLIENGAPAATLTADGNSALHAAARRGANPDFVKFLLSRGLDPHQPNHDGDTPLSLAKKFKRATLLPLLTAAPKQLSTPKPTNARRQPTPEDEEFERDLPPHMRTQPAPQPPAGPPPRSPPKRKKGRS